MKVAIFPYGGEENPYQRMVRDSLVSAGCDVETLERKGRFGGLQPLLSTEVDVISCDWLTGVYRGRSHFSTALKYLSTMKDLEYIRKPMVLTVHNIAAHEPPVSTHLERSAEKSLVQHMSGFAHFSQVGETAWNALHPTVAALPTTQIRIGNNIDEYENVVGKSHARQNIGIESDEAPVALCFGTIRPYKGFAELAEVFLQTSSPESILLIAGPPQDANEVERIGKIAAVEPNRIRTFFERIPDEDIQLFMNAADVGFAPFINVNNSSSITLMQSFGLTVAMPKIGGLPEAALHWNSLIYEPEELASVINPALDFGRQQLAKRAAAIEEIRQRDTWEKLATNFVELFEQVLK